jgi:hypothetical protein
MRRRLLLSLALPLLAFGQSKNLGNPYSFCQRASDLGFDTTGATDNTTKLHDFINGVLTVSGFKNGCIYADGIVRADGQIADAGWAALGGTITFQGDGAAAFNSSPGVSVLRGFDLRYTGGAKIKATWSGALVLRDINIFSKAGNSDCQSYIQAYLTAIQDINSAFIGAPTNGVGCQTSIEYGNGSAYAGYQQFGKNTRHMGMCSIFKLNASSPAANAILRDGDSYLGGDKVTPANCYIYRMHVGTSIGTRIVNGLYEGWDAANATRTINAVFDMNSGVSNVIIDHNTFFDMTGAGAGAYLIDASGGTPTNVHVTDTNYFDIAADHMWNSWPYGNGNSLPESFMVATTASYNPGSINAGACGTTTVAVSYATAGLPVIVNATTRTAGFIFDGTVSANGTVTVRVCNASGANGAPTASTYKVHVLQDGK